MYVHRSYPARNSSSFQMLKSACVERSGFEVFFSLSLSLSFSPGIKESKRAGMWRERERERERETVESRGQKERVSRPRACRSFGRTTRRKVEKTFHGRQSRKPSTRRATPPERQPQPQRVQWAHLAPSTFPLCSWLLVVIRKAIASVASRRECQRNGMAKEKRTGWRRRRRRSRRHAASHAIESRRART